MVPEEALFVIGNGTSTSARSNALVIRKDGTATFNDSLSVLGNATFANELSVGDTLRAAAPALFADSVYPVGGTSYTAGTGVNISGSNVISIGQGVATTDNVTFNSANISTFMMLTPSLTPASPTPGMVYYDSSINRLRIYTNFGWMTIDAMP